MADARFEIAESDFGSFRSNAATFCLAMTLAVAVAEKRNGLPAAPTSRSVRLSFTRRLPARFSSVALGSRRPRARKTHGDSWPGWTRPIGLEVEFTDFPLGELERFRGLRAIDDIPSPFAEA